MKLVKCLANSKWAIQWFTPTIGILFCKDKVLEITAPICKAPPIPGLWLKEIKSISFIFFLAEIKAFSITLGPYLIWCFINSLGIIPPESLFKDLLSKDNNFLLFIILALKVWVVYLIPKTIIND